MGIFEGVATLVQSLQRITEILTHDPPICLYQTLSMDSSYNVWLMTT